MGKLDKQIKAFQQEIADIQGQLAKEWVEFLKNNKTLYNMIEEKWSVEKRESLSPHQQNIRQKADVYKKEMIRIEKEIRDEMEGYENFSFDAIDEVDSDKLAAYIAGGGLAAGAGAAAFGPALAMAIAMNFGVAGGGAAIAGLGGIAAQNAALAWLGGGPLAAGGAGMAGGQALLGIFGPIGWAIGGVGLLGAAYFKLKSNREKKEAIPQLEEAVRQLTFLLNTECQKNEHVRSLQSNLRNAPEEMVELRMVQAAEALYRTTLHKEDA
ncbi:hypothetical protein GOP80_07560 [Planococcaceae bacterium Storch 2/2-2]|nr:hypothetical protein [Planococcaceae bacterium Storch 2/2-2]